MCHIQKYKSRFLVPVLYKKMSLCNFRDFLGEKEKMEFKEVLVKRFGSVDSVACYKDHSDLRGVTEACSWRTVNTNELFPRKQLLFLGNSINWKLMPLFRRTSIIFFHFIFIFR